MKKKYYLTAWLLTAVFLLPYAVFAQRSNLEYNTEQIFLLKFQNEKKIYKMHFSSLAEGFDILAKVVPAKKIDYLEPDYAVYASLIPNDPKYSEQWTLPKIKADQAWERASGEQVVIAILDSGVDIDHPDLSANIWVNQGDIADNGLDDDNNGFIDDTSGWDFISNDNDANPDLSEYETYLAGDQYQQWVMGVNHGTVVSGLAAAVGNNSEGIIGVGYRAKIMVIRILNSLGVGSTSSVAMGLDYAVNMGADIINLSFTGSETNQTLENALKNASDHGILIVAASGNNAINLNDTAIYPACSDKSGDKLIIGVAATDSEDKKPSWSNYGSDCIDISAPGNNLYSTVVYNPNKAMMQYYQSGWYGTSLSTPLVSGTAALVKSMYPEATNFDIAQALIEHAANLNTVNPDYIGQLGGLLDANASLGVTIIQTINPSLIVTGAGKGGGPHIRIYDRQGNLQSQFFAFEESFRGGVNVALGDINSDNEYEIIAGAGNGRSPQVRIFDQEGNLQSEFFAYAESFQGGVNVAVGDVDGDGSEDIITGTGQTGGPQVRIFDTKGNLLSQFFAYVENFRGGVYVTSGDLNGDGIKEIITGTGNGGGPQVRTFDYSGKPIFTPGFFAYAQNFRGGVLVSAGDLNGDGIDEIVTGTGLGGGPHVRTFDRYGKAIYTPGFFAYAENFRGGVLVTTGDLDGDGIDEIITGTGNGGGPHVRIFDRFGKVVFTPGFFAYAENFRGGVNVGSAKGLIEIIYQYGQD